MGDNVRQEFENLEWRRQDEPGAANVAVDIQFESYLNINEV